MKSYQEEVDYQTQRLAQLRQGRVAEAGITATQGRMLDATRTRLQNNLAAVRGSLDGLTIRAPSNEKKSVKKALICLSLPPAFTASG